MKFSVIIPAYNAQRYLEECLNSIAMQTYTDYELLLIDDGSSDKTAEIMDRFAFDRDDVHVHHGQNEGPLLARRRGLFDANGEYIVFLDADDCLKADALAQISRAIAETQADIIAFHSSRKENFSSADDTSALPAGLYCGEQYEIVKEHVCRGRFNNLWGKAFRAKCIDTECDYGRFKGLMHGEDLFQLLPIVERSSSLCQLSETLYYYRPNENSSTASYKDSQLIDAVQVNRRLNTFALSWGGECLDAACIGETNIYILLIKMSELSDVETTEKKRVFSEIREAMQNEGVFERDRRVRLRPDNALLFKALKNGNRYLAHLVAKESEALKGMAISAGFRGKLEGFIKRLGFK